MPYAIGKGQGMERIQELVMSGDLAPTGDKIGTVVQKDVAMILLKNSVFYRCF